MNGRFLPVLLLSAMLGGCSGLQLSEAEINKRPPADWQTRTFMKNVADFRFHLTENVGLVVTPKSDGTYGVVRQPIIPDGFVPREDVIKDGGVYSSILTNAASAQGGYLAMTASLSATAAVNYSITDVSRADIPWGSFPEAKIRAAAALPNSTGSQRLWIQSLILSRIVSTSSIVIDCNGQAATPVFKVGTTCHSESGETLSDYGIAAVFVDIDKWVQMNPLENHVDIAKSNNQFKEVFRLSKHGTGGNSVIPAYISVQPFVGGISDFLK